MTTNNNICSHIRYLLVVIDRLSFLAFLTNRCYRDYLSIEFHLYPAKSCTCSFIASESRGLIARSTTPANHCRVHACPKDGHGKHLSFQCLQINLSTEGFSPVWKGTSNLGARVIKLRWRNATPIICLLPNIPSCHAGEEVSLFTALPSFFLNV